ncbi:MAG: hypothetical protein GTO02_04135 [Candidatus Dadabacteria bacterium]|nr:hypothetical protein [Candidatus Dadabacteria bacterium]
MTQRPRVRKDKRLVCVYHESLECFEVYKITKKGKVSKKFEPRVAYTDDVKEAFRNIDVPLAGFRTVPKTSKLKDLAQTWDEYVEMIWAKAHE